MSELSISGHEIVCPRVEGGAVIINLAKIAEMEARLAEVALVTPLKAPELLSVFTEGWLSLQKHAIALENERLKADRAVRMRRSLVTLDIAPEVLRNKGLIRTGSPAGSEDMRQAVLDGDGAYQNSLALVYEIGCCIDLLKVKAKAFEMAYNSVKKILDADRYFYTPNPNLHGGKETETEVSPAGFGEVNF
jgi:hypothetical protein